MKTLDIIRRSVAGILITAVAVCTFGCSKTSITSKEMEDAFGAAAREYGLEEFDWQKRYESESGIDGFSSISEKGDDADSRFYSNVALVLGFAPNDDLPEIKEISVFYLGDADEMIYGHYVVFEDEDDCEEYRDIFYDWFGDEISEEQGFECFARLTDERMNALYRDGNTLIWITGYLHDTPEMLPYIYDELGLSFPEMSED